MCFSAEADLVGGLVVGAFGIDALRHVRRPTEVPLVALPLVLAGHQLVEALVWWGLDGRVPGAVGRTATWVYLVVAFGLLPVLVPFAVGALEPATVRRRVGALGALGLVVAALLVHAVVRGPVVAAVEGHHLDYRVDVWGGGAMVAVYVLVTCGSLLLSVHGHVRWFGLVNLVAVGLLTWLDQGALVSLWCAWAAVTSVAIAVHVRRPTPSRQAFVEA